MIKARSRNEITPHSHESNASNKRFAKMTKWLGALLFVSSVSPVAFSEVAHAAEVPAGTPVQANPNAGLPIAAQNGTPKGAKPSHHRPEKRQARAESVASRPNVGVYQNACVALNLSDARKFISDNPYLQANERVHSANGYVTNCIYRAGKNDPNSPDETLGLIVGKAPSVPFGQFMKEQVKSLGGKPNMHTIDDLGDNAYVGYVDYSAGGGQRTAIWESHGLVFAATSQHLGTGVAHNHNMKPIINLAHDIEDRSF